MAIRTLACPRLLLAVAVAVLGSAAAAPEAIGLPKVPTQPTTTAAVVPNPVVEGPITGGIHGRPWESYVPNYDSYSDITQFGYVEQEFFVSGTSDQQTPFKTRIIVRRPTNPAQFSGTVFAEWINVTAGDAETLWPGGHPTLMLEGHAYVGMSIQRVGVANIQAWDPVRYGSLNHPGDDPHANRILEQCIQAIRNPTGVDPMGGLRPQYVIVTGDSQSAGLIVDYIEQGYEIKGLIDGWMPGRGGMSAFVKRVMEELHMPLINLLEENQAEVPADSDYFRAFYGAGQAHAPYGYWSYLHAARERDLYMTRVRPIPEDAAGRVLNGGTGGMNHSYANLMVRAGIHWINRMVRAAAVGHLDNPPIQPRLVRQGGSLVRNADGYPLGGVRYPDVEVPIGLNTSETYPLFGIWDPWTAEEIIARYPTRQIYLDRIEDAIDAMVPTGMLLPIDVDLVRADAAALPVWNGAQARACYNESWGFPPDPMNPCLTLP